MSDANLGGKLPDGDANGLTAIAADLIAEPRRLRHAIVLLDTVKITSKVDDHTKVATARVRHIEPLVHSTDLEAADVLLRTALKRRTGSAALPGQLDQAELPFDPDDDEE